LERILEDTASSQNPNFWMENNEQWASDATEQIPEKYGMGAESLNHALVGCHHACQLRMAMREHWTLPYEEQFLNIDHLNFLVFLMPAERETRARCLMLL
jgi:hypothetical protein